MASRIEECLKKSAEGVYADVALCDGRTPFMPIFMRFCAQYAGVNYRDFVLDAEAHCRANILCARTFGSDWVNVMSDPYAEVSAYGGKITYPENGLPLDTGILCASAADVLKLADVCLTDDERVRGRLEQLRIFRRDCGDSLSICGWVEGMMAEYCDLRGMEGAFFDLYDEPETVLAALEVLFEKAREFCTLQVEAGATMIGIGDAACSQVGDSLYRTYVWDFERRLVEHIHSLGAYAKLHICGDTRPILPGMIEAGADIIDVDHLVGDIVPFLPLLQKGQVFCGNLDPVSVICGETPENIERRARDLVKRCGGKLILSGGCEITPETPLENVRALARACAEKN